MSYFGLDLFDLVAGFVSHLSIVRLFQARVLIPFPPSSTSWRYFLGDSSKCSSFLAFSVGVCCGLAVCESRVWAGIMSMSSTSVV